LINKILEIEAEGWIYFQSSQFLETYFNFKKHGTGIDPYKEITGKYLFFHEDPQILKQIAHEEIMNNGFSCAKINKHLLGTNKEHVLCLYYKDDSRKNELAKKYQGKEGMKYRYWKSDEDTRKGKYSKEFLDRITSSSK